MTPLYIFIGIVVLVTVCKLWHHCHLRTYPLPRVAIQEFSFSGAYAAELIGLYDKMGAVPHQRLSGYNMWKRIGELMDQAGCTYKGKLHIMEEEAYHTTFRMRDCHKEDLEDVPESRQDITKIELDPDNPIASPEQDEGDETPD